MVPNFRNELQLVHVQSRKVPQKGQDSGSLFSVGWLHKEWGTRAGPLIGVWMPHSWFAGSLTIMSVTQVLLTSALLSGPEGVPGTIYHPPTHVHIPQSLLTLPHWWEYFQTSFLLSYEKQFLWGQFTRKRADPGEGMKWNQKIGAHPSDQYADLPFDKNKLCRKH